MLVFLPSAAMTGATERAFNFERLDGRDAKTLWEFADTVGWHEMAHQWWGHQIGWESYRDQWISEGFSVFTAALTLEFVEGMSRANDYWERQREEIFDRRASVTNHKAGAMTQGYRLQTRRSPGAARAMIYAKGGYIVHMLRMMMRADGTSDPDAAFKAMMQEFATEWAGRAPSTDDFRVIAERHQTAEMDLSGDGTLNYFFDQWVYGTDIPRFESTLEVDDIGDNT